VADDQVNNYVVGRGRLFFGQFRKGTRKPQGQKYFGNTPELSLAQDEETLDHYSSEGGARVKDASVTLQTDSTGSFQCDNISNNNLALWFRGETLRRIEAGSGSASGTITLNAASPAPGDTLTINDMEIEFVAANVNPIGMQISVGATLAETATRIANFINATPPLGVTATAANSVVTVRSAAAGTAGNDVTLAKTSANITLSGGTLDGGTDVTESIAISRGLWYQLGVMPETPQGVRSVGGLALAGVPDEAYILEADTGRFYVHADAAVVDGTLVEATYGVAAAVEDVVIAKGENIEGELQFIANNAAGENKDYFWPFVRLTPDGDFSLKGDDWQNMTFNFEILKRDEVVERQYITTRGKVAA